MIKTGEHAQALCLQLLLLLQPDEDVVRLRCRWIYQRLHVIQYNVWEFLEFLAEL